MNTIDQLTHAFKNFLQDTFTQTELPHYDFTLNCDTQKQKFGDIATNVALVLTKKLGKNPRAIAQEITEKFSHSFIKKMEIAGPGFINITLTPDAFEQIALELFIQKDEYFHIAEPHGRHNVEFVSANPTGPLHLGHGRNGIIGDVLAKILKFVGHNTTAEHYTNDAGAQMVKLGNSFKIRCQQAAGQNVELPEDAYQGEYLLELAQQCLKEHPEALTQNDEFFRNYAYTHQLAQLKQTVENYGIHFDVWFSERTLFPDKVKFALDHLEKNNKTYKAEGAVWFKSTEYGDDKDRVLQKADGTYTYAASDAAYLLDKAERGFTRLILVLGQDHHSYPKRLDGLRQALGLDDVTLDCILYQLVSIKEDGEQMKLSKRAGRIVGLDDVTQTVGSDVARFFYLNRKADAHLEFDMSLALKKTDENPVYYLQYAYVRTKSILTKAAELEQLKNISEHDSDYITESEQLLIKKMAFLKDLLTSICDNYQVHLVTYYALELAHLFHQYYHDNRIIDLEDINQSRGRLVATVLVNDTLDRCLRIMGVSRPEKM